jgi:hypothetical protein
MASGRSALRSVGIPAALTIVATIAAFCTVYAISMPFQAGPNAAILSAVLALTQGRRGTSSHHSPWWKLVTFPIVAVGVSAIGWLLHNAFYIGAAIFISAMSFSIWSRQFGETVRRVGSVAALPLVAVLIAPAPPHAPGGHLINLFLVIVAGVSAYAWLIVLTEIAKRAGAAVSTPIKPAIGVAKSARKKGVLSPHTRMAIQMAVADSGQAEHLFLRSLNILLVLTTVGGLLLRLCPNGALLADPGPCGLDGAGVSLRQADVDPKRSVARHGRWSPILASLM